MGKGPPISEPRISKKLFFLNVLEVKGGVAEGDFKFKLVTVGDSGVGKSCLLTRFVQDFYSDFHVSTNGGSFDHVEQWMGQVQQHHECGPSTVKILIGNKADMVADAPPNKVVSEEEGRAK